MATKYLPHIAQFFKNVRQSDSEITVTFGDLLLLLLMFFITVLGNFVESSFDPLQGGFQKASIW